MSDKEKRSLEDDPLHKLLMRVCPADANGERSINLLASHLKISFQAIYKWIAQGKIPVDRAMDMSNLTGGQVPLTEFHPFIFKQ